jgi:hypothetical protein
MKRRHLLMLPGVAMMSRPGTLRAGRDAAQDAFFNFNYHWPLHGFGLPDSALKNIYRGAALSAFKQAQSSARA